MKQHKTPLAMRLQQGLNDHILVIADPNIMSLFKRTHNFAYKAILPQPIILNESNKIRNVKLYQVLAESVSIVPRSLIQDDRFKFSIDLLKAIILDVDMHDYSKVLLTDNNTISYSLYNTIRFKQFNKKLFQILMNQTIGLYKLTNYDSKYLGAVILLIAINPVKIKKGQRTIDVRSLNVKYIQNTIQNEHSHQYIFAAAFDIISDHVNILQGQETGQDND